MLLINGVKGRRKVKKGLISGSWI